MAKCELAIHLDGTERSFRAGDEVAGQVEVQVDDEVRCDGLVVEAAWHTHGKGNLAGDAPVRRELFSGTWPAGSVHRYEFRLRLPPGPVTLRGHYLNVDWEIQARADIPWAFDPKASQEVVVLPGAVADGWRAQFPSTGEIPAELQGEGDGPQKIEVAQAGVGGKVVGFGCVGFLLLLFAAPLLVGVGLLGAAGWRWYQGGNPLDEPGQVIVGAAFFLFSLGVLLKLLWNAFAKTKLGDVKLVVDPVVAGPGDEVRCTVQLAPRRGVELEGVTAKLHAQEVVVRGSGTNKRTFRHSLHESDLELSPARRLLAGQPFHAQAAVRIPPDALPSFAARSNELEWRLEVRVAVPRWPDWTDQQKLVVRPGRGAP